MGLQIRRSDRSVVAATATQSNVGRAPPGSEFINNVELVFEDDLVREESRLPPQGRRRCSLETPLR